MESMESIESMEAMEARKSTPKVCTLSNRGYERSEHPRTATTNKRTALRRSARTAHIRRPRRGRYMVLSVIPGVLASLVPPVTESGRLQRPPPVRVLFII